MSTDKRIEKLESEFKQLQDLVKEVRSSLGQKGEKLKDRAEDRYEDLRDRAEDHYEDFKDSAEDAWDEAQSRGQDFLKKTRRTAKKAYYNTVDYTQEHPWRVTTSALALIGVVGLVCYLASERSNSQLDYIKRHYRDFF